MYMVFHLLRDNTEIVYVGIVKCKINRNISGTPLDPKSFFEFPEYEFCDFSFSF